VLGVSLWARFDSNFQKNITNAFGSGAQLPVEMNNIHIVLYVMMGVGGALILCGGLGCLGACCESPCLLGTFFAIILILFLAEIAGAIYFFVQKDRIRDNLNTWYKEKVVAKYDPNNNNDDVTKMLDTLQRESKCCGATGCSDYEKLAKPPASCGCLNKDDQSVQGCMNKFYDQLKGNITIVAIVLAVLVAVELLAMIFACILCSSLRYE